MKFLFRFRLLRLCLVTENISINDPICENLISSTVLIKAGDKSGTGFFITPKCILTCRHVIEDRKSNLLEHTVIAIFHNGQGLTIEKIIDKKNLEKTLVPYPDFAIIEITKPYSDHVVSAENHEIELGQNVLTYGYTSGYGSNTIVEVEGFQSVSFSNSERILKLKNGQVEPGFSGSPMLNLRNGQVIGFLNATRDTGSNLGGFGIPINVVKNSKDDVSKKNEDKWKILSERFGTRKSKVLSILSSKKGKKNLNESDARTTIIAELNEDFDKFSLNKEEFINNIARSLEIQESDVQIHDIIKGSVIIEFSIPSSKDNLFVELLLLGCIPNLKIKKIFSTRISKLIFCIAAAIMSLIFALIFCCFYNASHHPTNQPTHPPHEDAPQKKPTDTSTLQITPQAPNNINPSATTTKFNPKKNGAGHPQPVEKDTKPETATTEIETLCPHDLIHLGESLSLPKILYSKMLVLYLSLRANSNYTFPISTTLHLTCGDQSTIYSTTLSLGYSAGSSSVDTVTTDSVMNTTSGKMDVVRTEEKNITFFILNNENPNEIADSIRFRALKNTGTEDFSISLTSALDDYHILRNERPGTSKYRITVNVKDEISKTIFFSKTKKIRVKKFRKLDPSNYKFKYPPKLKHLSTSWSFHHQTTPNKPE